MDYESVGLRAPYIPKYRPLSRRLDRCDRVIQNESRDPFGGNVYYVTMQITFLTRKFRNGERNLHCDVVHITTKWVSSLTLDCNGVFAIKAYCDRAEHHQTAIRGLLCAASSPSLATQPDTACASYVKCVIQRKVLGKRRGGIPTSNMQWQHRKMDG